MHRRPIFHTATVAAALFAAADAGGGAAAAEAEAPAKTGSIVPAKYAGKYKNGGSDPLAEFIKGQCTGKDGFEYSAFFSLCRLNGIPEDQITRYESDIQEKKHGAQGRARMTLRNMLEALVRKSDTKTLKKLDGTASDPIEVKKGPTAPGKAAAAAETETKETEAGTNAGDEKTEDEDGEVKEPDASDEGQAKDGTE